MKLKNIPFIVAAVIALGLAGCSKNESTTPAADGANKAADTATDAAKADATVKADAAATTDAAKPADTAKAADNSKAQGLIDQATGLVAANKFSDASGVLQQLDGQSLSSDQQTLVDGLKNQIQKAVAANAAGNAAGSVGSLLKK